MDNKKNHLIIGALDSTIYIKGFGHITANLSFPVREHLFKKIKELNAPLSLYIDLSSVTYMDSTFLGLLVGIEKRVFAAFKNHLHIINPNSDALSFLENMRLTRFLKIEEHEIPDNVEFCEFTDDVQITENEKSKIVLCAHQDLSEIDVKNKLRFEKLQKILEDRIKNSKDNNDG